MTKTQYALKYGTNKKRAAFAGVIRFGSSGLHRSSIGSQDHAR